MINHLKSFIVKYDLGASIISGLISGLFLGLAICLLTDINDLNLIIPLIAGLMLGLIFSCVICPSLSLACSLSFSFIAILITGISTASITGLISTIVFALILWVKIKYFHNFTFSLFL